MENTYEVQEWEERVLPPLAATGLAKNRPPKVDGRIFATQGKRKIRKWSGKGEWLEEHQEIVKLTIKVAVRRCYCSGSPEKEHERRRGRRKRSLDELAAVNAAVWPPESRLDGKHGGRGGGDRRWRGRRREGFSGERQEGGRQFKGVKGKECVWLGEIRGDFW